MTAEDRNKLESFKTHYLGIHERLNNNVSKAANIVGSSEKPSFENFAYSRSLLKKMIRTTKTKLLEVSGYLERRF